MLAVRTDLTLSFQETWKATLPLLPHQLSPCGLMSVHAVRGAKCEMDFQLLEFSTDAVLNDTAVVTFVVIKL